MAQAVAIVGTGQTECGKRTDVSYPELIHEAVTRAFEDSGLGPKDIDAVVAGSMPPAMEGVNNPHLYWADAMGALGKPLMRLSKQSILSIAWQSRSVLQSLHLSPIPEMASRQSVEML